MSGSGITPLGVGRPSRVDSGHSPGPQRTTASGRRAGAGSQQRDVEQQQRNYSSVSGTPPRPESTSRMEVSVSLLAARVAENQHSDVAGA